MASRRETRSRSGLGAPGSTGAEQTRDPLGAPGTTGAAPTSGGFDPASYDPAAQGQGQQHRPSEHTGYDLGGQGYGQQHRPSGYDQTGYDLSGRGHGQQHHAPGHDPSSGYDLGGRGHGQQHHAPGHDPSSGYDLGHQGQGQRQQHHSSGGGGNLTGLGMEQQSGTRGRETIQITTTTGAFDMPTAGHGVTTGLPTTTAIGGYGGGLDASAGTTDVGIDYIAGSEGRRTGTRDQRK